MSTGNNPSDEITKEGATSSKEGATSSKEGATSSKEGAATKNDATDEITSSKEDAAIKNDDTDIIGITREVLLHKENEYLMKKITEELTTWSDNNVKSAQYTIISIVISAIAILFGVILLIFEKSSYRQEVKNIISTSIIGTGGSVTLLGSLASLKDLFKQASEEAKDFEKTLESFKDLFKEPKKEDDDKDDIDNEIDKNKPKKIKELEKHLEDQKNIYIFLDGLNKNMQHMSICRSISVSIISLIFIMLAIISIFYLLFKEDETIFKKIDIFLISFSAYCLLYSICVMICIQIIIPSVTEKMLDPDYMDSFENYCSISDVSEDEKFKLYKSTVNVLDLIGFLWYRILELTPFKWIIKRISMGKIEFEGINR
ncbi:18775_t:CDS:2, partial [Gigaspora rosea]